MNMKEYTAIFEPGERNWSAWASDLPGCVAAGSTQAETEALLREAVTLHIAALCEEGEPIPDPTTQAIKLAVAL